MALIVVGQKMRISYDTAGSGADFAGRGAVLPRRSYPACGGLPAALGGGTQNGLISPAGCFSGTEEIYRDFLVGRIGAAYARIDLIAESVEVRPVTEDAAVGLFRYATDCIRRDTGEPYGIAGLETQLWVRQGGEWRLCHVHDSKQ